MDNAKNNKRKLSILNKIFLVANLFAVCALLISYSAAYINPADYWLPAFFGLGYPILLIVNILFSVYWALQWRWQLSVSFIAVIIGYRQIGNLLQFNFNSKPDNLKEDEVKVMSYNVRCFDLYNWSNNISTRNEIFNVLAGEDPDILNLQEFFTDDAGRFVTHDTIIKFLKAKKSHIEISVTVKQIHHWGLATYSRFPIVGEGKIDFESEGTNMCIYTDLKIKNDTVRVYNCHFQSIHFSREDYKYIEELKNAEKEAEVEGSQRIFDRLKLAFQKRGLQSLAVAEHLNKCPYKIILTGDFNDTPSSFSYRQLTQHLNDAFIEKGAGFGKTYINNFLPLRIDFILSDPQLKIESFQTLQDELSDHYPVVAILKLNSKSNKNEN